MSFKNKFSVLTGRVLVPACLAFMAILYTGCYYDVAEELYPPVDCNTDSVTYSQEITTIMIDNCYGCHSLDANQGDIIVEGYDKLKALVDNGSLIGSIKAEAGYSAMPKDAAALSDCDIAKVEKWIADGAPNN